MITTSAQLRDITPAMREAWLYIAGHVHQHGTTPTIGEVSRQLDISYSAAYRTILQLEQYGILTRRPANAGKRRAYILFVWPVVLR